MEITSAEQLIQRALEMGLIEPHQLSEIWSEVGSRTVALEEMRKFLLRRDLLTFYQIEHLIAGDRSSFFYGDWKVLYLVGRGTFARVYRAAHRTTNAQAAVKVLRTSLSKNPEEADRFRQEGEMSQCLVHPNIVPVYEVYSKGTLHYLVIEFVEGQNLREFMKVRKIFDPLDASKIMRDVANGLDFAFGRGITHRDLKMSNVLVSSLGQAKLVDFGLAGIDSVSAEDLVDGVANPRAIDYAGLERSTGVRNGDERSDIFFVGCMYYHMLTGVSPMVETRDRIQRLSTGRFRDIAPILTVKPELPPLIGMVVSKAIQFDADKRYQTPGELAAALQDVVDRLSGMSSAKSLGGDRPTGEGMRPDGLPRTLMLIESDVAMQNSLRDRLKRNGYRVLVTGNIDRARETIFDDPKAIDVVLVSTGALGKQALEVFNQLGQSKATQEIPAVILFGQEQESWSSKAMTADHRAVLTMPVTLRQVRAKLAEVNAVHDASHP